MKNTKSNTAKIVMAILALLLVSSMAMISNSGSNTASAQDYGDIMQYDWPLFLGNSSTTRYSAGPASSSFDVLWDVDMPGITSMLIAIDDQIICGTGAGLHGMDPFTGETEWVADNVTSGSIFGIEPHYVIAGNSPNTGCVCVDTRTGGVLWTADAPTIQQAANHQLFSHEEMMYYKIYTKTGSDWATYGDEYEKSTAQSMIEAWDFSDPTQPPTLAWRTPILNTYVDYMLTYGDGKVFVPTPDAEIVCLDAKTGANLWTTATTGNRGYGGAYYMGRYIHGGLDSSMYCLDGDTGEVLWRYDPETFWGFWACGPATAYGMVYEINTDGHLYALDVETGEVVWKYGGAYEGNPNGVLNYYPGYPLVVDGKIIQAIGWLGARNQETGEFSRDETVCLDAYTGKLLWSIPLTDNGHGGAHGGFIAAYGNLYFQPTETLQTAEGQPIFLEGLALMNFMNRVVCIGGEPNDWSMFRSNPAQTAQGPGPTNLALKWTFETGGAVTSSPSIVDGVVYVGSNDKNIYALDAETGSKIWNFTTGYKVRSSPAVVGGKVYSGTDDGNMYCLDAETGTKLWETSAGGVSVWYSGQIAHAIRSSPIVTGGRVYVGSLDENLYCFNTNTGSVIWKFPSGGGITCTPTVISNDGVYFVSATPPPDYTLYKLNPNDGTLIWNISIPRDSFPGTFFEGHPSSPTVADGMVFTTDESYYLYCINATTGEQIWKVAQLGIAFGGVPYASSPLYVDGTLYSSDWFYISSFNATSGERYWSTWLAREVFVSPTYSYDGKIYIGCEEGTFRVLDAKTGEKLSYYHPGVNIWSTPSLYNGKMYIGAHDFKVYCFEQADLGLTTIYTKMTASVSSSNITLGETVTVTGTATTVNGKVPLGIAPMKVSFIRPDLSTVDTEPWTDADGNFQVSTYPDVAGTWRVVAYFEGNSTWAPTYVDLPDAVTVTAASAGPSDGTTPAGIPVEYVYAVVAVIVIVVAALGAYMFLKRRK